MAWDTEKEEKLRQLVVETLGIDEDEVNDETGPDTVSAWTSLAHLTLMSAVEESFTVQMTMDEMTTIKNVAGLRTILSQYV